MSGTSRCSTPSPWGGQSGRAMSALRGVVTLDVVGLGHRPQRITLVADLAAALLIGSAMKAS